MLQMLPTIRNNRHYAILVLSVTAVCLLYYSLWVLGLPFVDEEYLPAVSWSVVEFSSLTLLLHNIHVSKI